MYSKKLWRTVEAGVHTASQAGTAAANGLNLRPASAREGRESSKAVSVSGFANEWMNPCAKPLCRGRRRTTPWAKWQQKNPPNIWDSKKLVKFTGHLLMNWLQQFDKISIGNKREQLTETETKLIC